MKRLEKIKCEDIERILINRSFNELSSDEQHFMTEHLKHCDHCQRFEQTILNLMQVSQEQTITPDPKIRENILSRMGAATPVRIRILRSRWEYVRNILEYRIPVYQALVGVVSILLIVFSINRLSQPIKLKHTSQKDSVRVESILPDQMNIIKNFEIIEQQKIGRSVKEDSILTRYIVTAM